MWYNSNMKVISIIIQVLGFALLLCGVVVLTFLQPKVISIILQILGFVFLAGGVAVLTFLQPGAFSGFEGKINGLLTRVGLSGSHDGVKRHEKTVWWLIGLSVACGAGGLILELFIE